MPTLRGHRRTACTGPSIQHAPRLLLAQMRGSLLWETFGVSGGGSCPPAPPWHPVPCPPLLLCCSDTAIKWIGVDPAARPSPCVRSPHCGRTSSLVICWGGDLWGEGGGLRCGAGLLGSPGGGILAPLGWASRGETPLMASRGSHPNHGQGAPSCICQGGPGGNRGHGGAHRHEGSKAGPCPQPDQFPQQPLCLVTGDTSAQGNGLGAVEEALRSREGANPSRGGEALWSKQQSSRGLGLFPSPPGGRRGRSSGNRKRTACGGEDVKPPRPRTRGARWGHAGIRAPLGGQRRKGEGCGAEPE